MASTLINALQWIDYKQLVHTVLNTTVMMSVAIFIVKIWFNRYVDEIFSKRLEHYKHELSVETEKIKSELQGKLQKELEINKLQLDLTRVKGTLYSQQQFEAYNTLWGALISLKFTADALWSEANRSNLKLFVSKLKDTRETVNRNMLLLEEKHAEKLDFIIGAFENYQIGKERLIEVKNNHHPDLILIQEMIYDNKEIKDLYDELLIELKNLFFSQIRITNELATYHLL